MLLTNQKNDDIVCIHEVLRSQENTETIHEINNYRKLIEQNHWLWYVKLR